MTRWRSEPEVCASGIRRAQLEHARKSEDRYSWSVKKRRLYETIALAAFLAFLPVLYRFFPNLSWTTLLVVSSLTALVAGFLEYRRGVQPYLDLLEKRRYLYSYACDDALDNLLRHDSTVRLNVMEIDRGLLPGRGKFKIVHPLRMEGEPDEGLELRLDQGVCGQAVSQRGFCIAELGAQHGPTFNLDAEQREKTRHLKLILSMPIRRAKKGRGGSVTLTDEIIGVVNIDSKRRGALGYYRRVSVGNQSLLQNQTEALRKSANCVPIS